MTLKRYMRWRVLQVYVWVSDLTTGPLILWHTLVCGVRLGLGRWYVMRDRPSWFVEGMSEWFEPQPNDPLESQLKLEAQREWALRQRRDTSAE